METQPTTPSEIDRNALKQFLKKMRFTLTLEEALKSESCMNVFRAYQENILAEQTTVKQVTSLVTIKEGRPRTFKSKTGKRSSATQHDSYQTLKSDLGKKQLLVLNAIENNPGKSRSEITTILNSSGTTIKHSSVTGRCRELLDFGYIRKVGITWDPITKRNVETLAATTTPTKITA